MSQAIYDVLRQRFGDRIVGANLQTIDPWIEIVPAGLVDVCRFLRDEPGCQFDMLNCISGVDYLHTDPKKAARAEWEPHLELVYQLSSTVRKHTLVVKVSLPRWQDGVEGQLPAAPSVTDLWRTADWHEREVYDLVGVRFTGHADLRRILCPDDWAGHPLRKDYQPPLEYGGIRCR